MNNAMIEQIILDLLNVTAFTTDDRIEIKLCGTIVRTRVVRGEIILERRAPWGERFHRTTMPALVEFLTKRTGAHQ